MLLYRYRPLRIPGIGKHVADEIAQREMFLATLSENNDPMDGVAEVFWQGDRILWTNLIKHYCYCLMQAYWYVLIVGNQYEFLEDNIHIKGTHEDSPTTQHRERFKRYWSSVECDGEVKSLIDYLQSKGAFSSTEIGFLLRRVHPSLISILFDMEPIPGGAGGSPPDLKIPDLPINFYEALEGISQADLRKLAQLSELGFREIALISRLAAGDASVYQDNLIKIVSEFPDMYVSSAAKNTYYEDYLACFSEKNDIELMWAHYASGHSGICLVFDVEGEKLETEGDGFLPIYKVRYNDVPPRINYFETLGHLPRGKLDSSWMTIQDEVSPIKEKYDGKYHEFFWENYKLKSTHKLSSWSYEQEHRVVKSSWFVGKQDKEKRLIRYKEKHLKGITFGIRTPLADQIKIAKALDESLSQEAKKDFKFACAYYCGEDKRLKIRNMNLLKFSQGKA